MEIEPETNKAQKKALLILNCILLSIGHCGGPLIMRLYFLHGGKRVWLSSWLLTGGWPIILIPIFILYYRRRAAPAGDQTKLFLMKPFLFVAAAFIGIITGLDDYLYAYGVARLPVTTTALIIATQLAFTAVFAFLLVRQKFTSYSINAVVLLTIGGVVLALHTSGDRPKGESNKEYVVGFVMTVAAAVLYGFILPLMELTYKKARQVVTYTLVLEIQMVMCIFATLFSTVGMLINSDFKSDLVVDVCLVSKCLAMTMSDSQGSKAMMSLRNYTLTIADCSSPGANATGSSPGANATGLSLLGQVLSSKRVSKVTVQQILSRAWNTKKPWTIVEPGRKAKNMFVFLFEVEEDKLMVLERRAWTVKGNLMLLNEWDPDVPTKQIDFSKCAL